MFEVFAGKTMIYFTPKRRRRFMRMVIELSLFFIVAIGIGLLASLVEMACNIELNIQNFYILFIAYGVIYTYRCWRISKNENLLLNPVNKADSESNC